MPRIRRGIYNPLLWQREATARVIEYLDRRMRQMFRRDRSTISGILQPLQTAFLQHAPR